MAKQSLRSDPNAMVERRPFESGTAPTSLFAPKFVANDSLGRRTKRLLPVSSCAVVVEDSVGPAERYGWM